MLMKIYEVNKKTDEEFFLGEMIVETIPLIGAEVIFEDFENIYDLNVYKIENICYVYSKCAERPQIEIFVKKIKDNEVC